MIIPATMSAVQLIGHGGPEMLRYRDDVPVPAPGEGEVLVRVKAAGINNTDINTRIGWYSAQNRGSTDSAAAAAAAAGDGDWMGRGLAFPRIQGADVCGEIVSAGPGVERGRIGERIIVHGCLASRRQGNVAPWLGSEIDGGFAQFACVPSLDTYRIRSDLSDAQLAAIPCAFGTAENLLCRAGVKAGETVLVTGASGNVGLAAVQLARLRGAEVVAIAAQEKAAAVLEAGAHRCIDRGAALSGALKARTVDTVIDVVGGPQFPVLLDCLRPLGRYAVSGAIAGPVVETDLRTVYLKDLTLYGCTFQDSAVFRRLVDLIDGGALRPRVAEEYPLREIGAAQEAFLSKRHAGKIVLVPPPLTGRI